MCFKNSVSYFFSLVKGLEELKKQQLSSQLPEHLFFPHLSSRWYLEKAWQR
jgi:hypothetical protein